MTVAFVILAYVVGVLLAALVSVIVSNRGVRRRRERLEAARRLARTPERVITEYQTLRLAPPLDELAARRDKRLRETTGSAA